MIWTWRGSVWGGNCPGGNCPSVTCWREGGRKLQTCQLSDITKSTIKSLDYCFQTQCCEKEWQHWHSVMANVTHFVVIYSPHTVPTSVSQHNTMQLIFSQQQHQHSWISCTFWKKQFLIDTSRNYDPELFCFQQEHVINDLYRPMFSSLIWKMSVINKVYIGIRRINMKETAYFYIFDLHYLYTLELQKWCLKWLCMQMRTLKVKGKVGTYWGPTRDLLGTISGLDQEMVIDELGSHVISETRMCDDLGKQITVK